MPLRISYEIVSKVSVGTEQLYLGWEDDWREEDGTRMGPSVNRPSKRIPRQVLSQAEMPQNQPAEILKPPGRPAPNKELEILFSGTRGDDEIIYSPGKRRNSWKL